MQHNGTLLIADISGYTAFLTQGELTHAQEILESLMHTLLSRLSPPLTVSKLEGDAILCHAPDGTFLMGQSLLDLVDAVYCDFARSLDLMHVQTTCTCTACKLIPSLGLKFVVHHGEYLERPIGQRVELAGPSVIAVHRLLKNTIVEKFGTSAYVFYSDAALEALGLQEAAKSLQPHMETYEHLGDVCGHVADLQPMWLQAKLQDAVTVADRDLMWQKDYTMPTTMSVAWEYLTDPARMLTWIGASKFFIANLQGGRIGSGSVQHCEHGSQLSLSRIVDWRPFAHFAADIAMMPGVTVRYTMDVAAATPATSKITLRYAKPVSVGWKWCLMPLLRPVIGHFIKSSYEKHFVTLVAMIQAEATAGRALTAPKTWSKAEIESMRALPAVAEEVK